MDNSTEQSLLEFTSEYYYDDFDLSDLVVSQPCRPIVVENFVRVFVPILYSLVLLLGVLGNMMVILIIGRLRSARRTLTDTFILHLAGADLLLVLTLPFWAVEAVMGWTFGTTMCKLIGAIFALNLYSSILFLVCISFDRYLAIVHAIHMYRKRKPVYVHLACIVVWSFCLLLATVDLIFRDVYTSSYLNTSVCTYMFHPDSAAAWKLTIVATHHVIGFFVPMAAMLYCYCLIFKTLCRAHMLERQKTLKVVVALVVVFVVCWLPYNAVLFVDTLQSLGAIRPDCSGLNVLDISRTVTQSLGLVHCCLNPLLYAFIGVKFRREVLSLLAHVGCPTGRLASGRHSGKLKRTISAISDSETSTSHSVIW
ncbi:C-X-C chemokine receptor type 3-2-like isoform X1 [Hemiscyllium ocellatum]|uniref:C-X-C chemokine receptor type 3-2-like isoform X1 n=1 Tax=Hemiscyllium ocellatum TaxID=170820 RepID=UPI002965FB5E|nr:C-X-C chemokine receptor type 3-2-like isoform X1 [Hemiscyllium ocellatum]